MAPKDVPTREEVENDSSAFILMMFFDAWHWRIIKWIHNFNSGKFDVFDIFDVFLFSIFFLFAITVTSRRGLPNSMFYFSALTKSSLEHAIRFWEISRMEN